MAERNDSEPTGSDASANPENAASTPVPKGEKGGLPSIASPSLSPAAGEPESVGDPGGPGSEAHADADENQTGSAPEVLPPVLYVKPAAAPPHISDFKVRRKHYALLAASLTIAAAIGVVFGALAAGGFSKPEAPAVNVATQEESKAMQQSIARLTKEVTTLRSNLEAANKTAHTQIAKLNDKLAERIKRESADITGSISPPQTAAPSPAEQPAQQAAMPTPLPTPRPARVASAAPEPVAPPPSMRPSIVSGWWIRDARDGYVYVEGHGEVYEVVPGAPLPGLGPVEQIKRQDGRWVVVTPRGIIVSMRDRRYFESF